MVGGITGVVPVKTANMNPCWGFFGQSGRQPRNRSSVLVLSANDH